jgi:carboxypeptidase Q
MKKIIFAFVFCLSFSISNSQKSVFDNEDELFVKYKDKVEMIIKESEKNNASYDRLAYLCDTYGHRLSGSEGLEKALAWIYQEMIKDNMENVQLDDVMVPNWKRGNEYCNLVYPRNAKIKMLALGNSLGTPLDGITAEVYVVSNKEELLKNPEKAKGKIVLFNAVYKSYGETVQFRFSGAQWAAEAGAVASMIRSVSPHDMNSPHTGVMSYGESARKIPHIAITSEDADMLQRMQERGVKPVVKIYSEAHFLPDALSHNVMSEVVGYEKPDEIIVAGGHIDSWDVGTGAMDDAGGCVSTWEAVRIIKDLKLKPKRTIRVCHWTNEENGTAGGKAYAELHKKEKHIMGFEFDVGVFAPSHIRFTGDEKIYKKIKNFEKLLKLVDKDLGVAEGGGGVDIGPLVKQANIPAMSLSTGADSNYFWYHHSDTDTMDKIKPADLKKCVSAIAVTLYLYSEMD